MTGVGTVCINLPYANYWRHFLPWCVRLVVAVVQREGGGGGLDAHTLHLMDMDNVDRTCAFALPDAEVRPRQA